MTERNVVGSVTAAALSPLMEGWESMLVWIVVALVLIIADLRFGIEASRKRHECIRTSRAIRRTINKFVDYLCWVSIAWVLGGTFGNIFGIPLLPAIVMLGVCAIELSSIIGNYFAARGIQKKFNIWKFILKSFHKEQFEDCLEDQNKPIPIIKEYGDEDTAGQRTREGDEREMLTGQESDGVEMDA